MMYTLYRDLHRLKYLFLICAIAMVAFFLYVSNSLVAKLSEEERVKAQIWAAAVRDLASDETVNSVVLASKVITSNTTIPVMITESRGRIIAYNNFDSTKIDTAGVYLRAQLERLKLREQVIEIPLDTDRQYLYYDDSSVLRALSSFPYVQLLMILVFGSVVFMAFASAKKAEQRQVWVGLTKETAHQLGTPISSLLALGELLKGLEIDPPILHEMNKDVARLQTIAERFSKIGSKPEPERVEASQALTASMDYMKKRSSANVEFELFVLSKEPLYIKISPPLFEWVVENLTKNAIDAMDGRGAITITMTGQPRKVAIDFRDTGKGIAPKYHKSIFYAGFTSKKRGWGLGLTLVKRIVEEFFDGKIFVKQSEEGKGTTFRLLLPLAEADDDRTTKQPITKS